MDYRTALLILLDQVDYTIGNCRPNEMVAAVLPMEIIALCREAAKQRKEGSFFKNCSSSECDQPAIEGTKLCMKHSFDKAAKMTAEANSEEEYKAASRVWAHIDGGFGYFKDKVAYCDDMAEKCREIDEHFKHRGDDL